MKIGRTIFFTINYWKKAILPKISTVDYDDEYDDDYEYHETVIESSRKL